MRSEPAANAVLDAAPSQVRLWFDEDVDSQLSEIQILNSTQSRVDKSDLALAPNDSKQISVSLKSLLDESYTVVWKVLSATDGHVTRGTFAFGIGRQTTPPIAPTASATSEAVNDDPLSVAARWLDLAALLTTAGALFFRDRVLCPSLRSTISEYAATARALWQRLLVLALTLSFIGEILRVLFEARLATGAFTPDQVARVVFDTRVGILWITRWVALTVAGLLVLGIRTRASALVMLGESVALVLLYTGILADPKLVGQFGALSSALAQAGIVEHIPHVIPLFLFVAVVIFRDDTTRNLVAQLLLLLALLTLALESHNAAEGDISLPVLADWMHRTAVSMWMGGLVTLTWIIRPTWRSLAQDKRRIWLMAVVSRFSPLAMIAPSHYMMQTYYDFDAPIQINAPSTH